MGPKTLPVALNITRGLEGWVRTWCICILILGLLVILLTFSDYGVTWDESVHSRYGELVVEYFRSGLRDTRANSFVDMKYYGPLFDMAAALIYQFNPVAKYEIRHFLIALLALLAIPGVIKYGHLFDDPYVPFFSSLILILLPRFYGHAFNNPKDIPFACFFVWSMFLMARLFKAGVYRWKDFLACGALIGITLSIRPGGLPILLFYFLAGLALTISMDATFKGRKLTDKANWLFLLQGISLFSVAWIIMVSLWPWAHENILLNPLRAMSVAASFIQSYPVLFEGKVFPSNELPGYYPIKYLWVTTPPAVIFFAIVGMILCGKKMLQDFQSPSAVVCSITLLWFWFPIIYFFFRRPNVYDEIRHFLFILPALAVLAGIGAAGLLRIARAGKLQRLIFPVLVFVLLIPVKDLFELHPYQMTYFNFLAGGVARASREYETDYWVSSYKEAMQWVNRQREAFPGRKIVVLVAANGYSFACADYYRAPEAELRAIFEGGIQGPLPKMFDFYIATTRYGFDRNFPEAPVVHTVGRKGAVFTVVKGRR